MSQRKDIAIGELKLDLSNFRTVPQADEAHALHAMATVSPAWFWALTESLIDDGYLPTENIIVLETSTGTLTVKEGNRRIAALKLVHGLLSAPGLAIPSNLIQKITSVPSSWKALTQSVPCVIYPPADAAVVDRIVALAHGKGEQAGRDHWTAIARARHARDVSGETQPALDLLEAFLIHAKNATPNQKELWSGDYPLTVLEEAMKKLASRFGSTSGPDLAAKYLMISYRTALDEIIKEIGLGNIGFKQLRDKNIDLATKYGVPAPTVSPTSVNTGGAVGAPSASTATAGTQGQAQPGSSPAGPTAPGTTSTGPVGPSGPSAPKTGAVSIDDPKAVRRALRKFKVLGANRNKVETLRKEAVNLDLVKTPLAFCFVLRSMFEISAKAYCDDHKASGGPSAKRANGYDRDLVDVLADVAQHLISTSSDKGMQKRLYGASTELSKKEGILSVTSMNQLIHSPTFSVSPSDVSITFGNVFPLLVAMNS